jgi:hypothetical protein
MEDEEKSSALIAQLLQEGDTYYPGYSMPPLPDSDVDIDQHSEDDDYKPSTTAKKHRVKKRTCIIHAFNRVEKHETVNRKREAAAMTAVGLHTGLYTEDEERLFRDGLEQYGRDWKLVLSTYMPEGGRLWRMSRRGIQRRFAVMRRNIS